MRRASVSACVLLLLAASCSSATEGGQEPPGPNQIQQDGITFTDGWPGAFHGPEAVEAMANLADTGAGWVALVFGWYQGRIAATDIRPLKSSPSDEDVVSMIRVAHDLGLKVMLKPHVELLRKWWNKPRIGTAWGDDQAAWDAWFASYEAYVFHYADIAEAEGVEQFAIGTEARRR